MSDYSLDNPFLYLGNDNRIYPDKPDSYTYHAVLDVRSSI